MFGHHLDGYQSGYEQQPGRNDNQVIEISQDRDEIRDKVDWTEQVCEYRCGQDLSVPRYSRVFGSKKNRMRLGL